MTHLKQDLKSSAYYMGKIAQEKGLNAQPELDENFQALVRGAAFDKAVIKEWLRGWTDGGQHKSLVY